MDITQNGESSKHCQNIAYEDIGIGVNRDVEMADGDVEKRAKVETMGEDLKKRGKARLIMPQWDTVPPIPPIHPSQDLLSMMHLDTLYDIYVQPLSDDTQSGTGIGTEGDESESLRKKAVGRRKLEKGYAHLIEDCIDPTPLGHNNNNCLLMSLLGDCIKNEHQPPMPAPFPPGPINPQSIQQEWYQRARLEAGLIQDGYIGGEKAGVREAEEKRRRKRVARINSVADAATVDANFPPFPFSNANSGSSAPVNPAIPVAPLQRGYPRPPQRGTAPPGIGPGVHFPSSKSQQAQAQNARPIMSSTTQRPSSVDVVTTQYRRSGSRSASPMPSAGLLPPKQGQGPSGVQRSFPSNKNKRPGNADVQASQLKRPKSATGFGRRPESPMLQGQQIKR
ncbi:hypothetical protein L204_105425 [Cryptococcus depauperatus]|nr:hypothetical protein L204_02807 [Cryptococcus depauperatus CBS 7855]